MARSRTLRYMPVFGDEVLAPSYIKTVKGQLPATVIDVNRHNGITGATVQYHDVEIKSLPDHGMHWQRARDLKFVRRRGGVSTRPEPSRGALLAKTTDFAGDSAEDKISLPADAKPATLTRGGKSRRRSSQPKRRTTSMATTTRGRKRSTKQEEPEQTAAPRGRKSRKAAPEPEPVSKTNGNRRTHEDILELVPEIVEKLQDGVTMTDIRAEYGAGPVIRKALTERGYNTKGERVEVEDLTELKGKALLNAVIRLREEGKAWYYIELATDMSQGDLQDMLEEGGREDLAAGRVAAVRDDEDEEPEEKPVAAKRGRRAKSEPVAEETPAPKRGRGRPKRKANPSEES